MLRPFLVKMLASGLGAGYVPLMPGTCGSLWGVLIFYHFRNLPAYWLGILSACITFVAIVIANEAEKIFGEKDCQKIVIDEVAGQLVTYLLVPYSLANLVAGFVLFRFFDMTKIFPSGWVQRNVPGGRGVVLDDLVAGLQAAIVLYLINLYII